MNGVTTIGTRSAITSQLLVDDLEAIGHVTYRALLGGHGLFESGVMFGFVNCRGESFLRTDATTAQKYVGLGAEKHPAMPYWRIPLVAFEDNDLLIELAYEASDIAHLQLVGKVAA